MTPMMRFPEEIFVQWPKPTEAQTHAWGRMCDFFNTSAHELAFLGHVPIEIPNVGREDLAELFAYLGCAAGAEIGVAAGMYTEVLAKANPQARHIWAVDPWTPYAGYREFKTHERLDGLEAEARERLQPYSNVTIIKQFSEDAAREFADGTLDFVYLDANHDFPHVTADLAAWTPKVRSGGIIAGHDYCQRKAVTHPYHVHVHVVEVLKGWTEAYGIRPWFLLGRKAIIAGEVRDQPRSWFWVQP